VWLAIVWSAFQVYTAYAGMWDLLIQLPLHVAFAVALGFLTPPIADSTAAAAKLARHRPRRWLDVGLAALSLLCAASGTIRGWRAGWPWWTTRCPSTWR
jgi:TRAP-type uncharacterized transport system fused permease subunit